MPPEIYGAIRLAEKHEAIALNPCWRRQSKKRLIVKHLCKAQKLRHRATRLGEQR